MQKLKAIQSGLLVGCLTTAAALAVACGSGETGEDLATVHIAIEEVPADVQCIELTARGSRTVTERFDVAPGASSVLALNRLPVGTMRFSGEAYDAGCSDVGNQTAATWFAEEVTASLLPGIVNDVLLTMRRNGRVRARVDFEDDGECLDVICDDGIACTVDYCDPATGECIFDDSACECSTNADCSDSDQCTEDICNPDGSCSNPITTGAACDDGNICTANGQCSSSGECVSVPASVRIRATRTGAGAGESQLDLTCGQPETLAMSVPDVCSGSRFEGFCRLHANGSLSARGRFIGGFCTASEWGPNVTSGCSTASLFPNGSFSCCFQ